MRIIFPFIADKLNFGGMPSIYLFQTTNMYTSTEPCGRTVFSQGHQTTANIFSYSTEGLSAIICRISPYNYNMDIISGRWRAARGPLVQKAYIIEVLIKL